MLVELRRLLCQLHPFYLALLDAWTVFAVIPLLMPPLCVESIQYFQLENQLSVWFAWFLEVYRVRP